MIPMDYQIARVWDIPIRVHISLILFLPIIAWQFSPVMGEGMTAWFWGLGTAVGLFVSVALHELGHSLVALRMGFRVREILLLPIGGAAQLEQIPSRPRQELLMALAGPAVSLLTGIVCWGVGWGLHNNPRWGYAATMFIHLAVLNVGLAIFNMLPSFPMDGGRVFRAILTPKLGRLKATALAVGIGKTIAVILGVLGAFPPFNLLLVAIAFFLYSTASAEYRMVQREATWADRSRPPPLP